ncbi:hypothetical protein LguiA_015654 [Lonicera macranthoides]
MAFTGTTQKCKACDKTVHFVEMVSADGVPYHKTCFRCSQCNGKLAMSNYSAIEGKLYCKPHFEQLLKETGSFTRRSLSGRLNGDQPRTPGKAASVFTGTQDKCAVCKKTVYPLEKVSVEGEFFHKSCFRCSHGGCNLTTSSYAALDGILYCKPHFSQLFKEKGCYNHLTKTASQRKSDAASTPTEDGDQTTSAETEPESADANNDTSEK